MTREGALLFAALIGAWWPVRAWIARRTEQRFMREHPRDGEGYIVGAAPRTLIGPRPGALLLLHGYNDSPQSLYAVAETIHARGWTVRIPALPGHGRTLQEFTASGADAWIDAARAELRALEQQHGKVAVGGLSMGGAIAFVLAAETPSVTAVLTFAPYLHASVPLRLMAMAAPIAAVGSRYVVGGGSRSVHDPLAAEQMIAYRMSTPRLVVQLAHVVHRARRALVQIRQPVLVMQSREDNRIPQHSAEESFGRIASTDKTLYWTEGSGHVITVDYGHEALATYAADWLETRLP